MNISAAKDLKDLLDTKYKQLISKPCETSLERIRSQYEYANEKTFKSIFYKRSIEITNLLKLDDLYLYSITNSVHAVNNSIDFVWKKIHKDSILITDQIAF